MGALVRTGFRVDPDAGLSSPVMFALLGFAGDQNLLELLHRWAEPDVLDQIADLLTEELPTGEPRRLQEEGEQAVGHEMGSALAAAGAGKRAGEDLREHRERVPPVPT